MVPAARSRGLPLLAILAAGALGACASPEASWPDPTSLATATAPAPSPSASPTPRDAAADSSRPFVALEHPPPDAVFGSAPAYLAGQARAPVGARHHDLVVVLDISGSTAADAADPDARGPLHPVRPTPPGSILATEVEAARALLAQVDFRGTRVAVVTFSGAPDGPAAGYRGMRSWHRQPAQTVEPLSRDPEALEAAFDRILADGPGGMTHMAAGLRRAVAELVGGPEARSRPDPASAKVVVFLTDGVPTLPYGTRRANEHAVLAEVERAASYGVRIHSYGIGPEALEGPLPLVEMARRTRGSFVPVRDPAALPRILPRLRFGALESLRVRNRTTGEPALASLLRPDGSFDALVRLAPGPNDVEVVVEARDGGIGRRRLSLVRRDGVVAPDVPPRLGARRTALAEELAVRRAELWGQILREREAAEGRAAARRRELELTPLDPAAPADPAQPAQPAEPAGPPDAEQPPLSPPARP